jgi:hypothetical protein
MLVEQHKEVSLSQILRASCENAMVCMRMCACATAPQKYPDATVMAETRNN